ncbi:hypothetical protein J2Y38_004101 [Flavobacterium sp. 2755]|uniref:hypothetical protein n=1 Tax=Flavobacterium sp. 2755 TaxID=2817765 RepID=UPI00285EF0DE|nr:hypothetical protein [Flavobacterium sp. 2755]MDR6763877.1 hypothetical protein [Flavobacterium sp. 2755]
MKYKYKTSIYILGVLLLVISILDKIYWIYMCTKYTDFEETKAAYLSLFPEFIANAFFLTIIDIIVSGIAAIIFYESKKTGYLKRPSKVLMIVSLILCGWSIFSLM